VVTDADQDTRTVAEVTATTAQSGTASLIGSTITYTPPNNYSGPDALSYVISDGFCTVTGTVSVTVRLGNYSSVIGDVQAQPDGSMQLIGSGIPGYAYTIQATTNVLNAGSWVAIGTNVALTNGLILYLDLDATNYPSRYYRLAAP
jgi:hypothetical protein